MAGDPLIATSALKHLRSKDDILHAYRNPIRAWDLGDGFTMIIGASPPGALLEIGYVQGVDHIVIIHAMPARRKFLR